MLKCWATPGRQHWVLLQLLVILRCRHAWEAWLWHLWKREGFSPSCFQVSARSTHYPCCSFSLRIITAWNSKTTDALTETLGPFRPPHWKGKVGQGTLLCHPFMSSYTTNKQQCGCQVTEKFMLREWPCQRNGERRGEQCGNSCMANILRTKLILTFIFGIVMVENILSFQILFHFMCAWHIAGTQVFVIGINESIQVGWTQKETSPSPSFPIRLILFPEVTALTSSSPASLIHLCC